jgi:hypothetical protein
MHIVIPSVRQGTKSFVKHKDFIVIHELSAHNKTLVHFYLINREVLIQDFPPTNEESTPMSPYYFSQILILS